MRKLLVTGGTVFVSKRIAEYFVKAGDEVYVLNRNTRSQVEGVKLIEADRHLLKDELKGHHFDGVIDVTAYTGKDVEILLNALESFDDYVLISSSAVYPETNVQPFHESQNVGYNYRWKDYGMGKIEAEKVLFERVPHAYSIRPAYLYGPYESLYREPFVFDCALAHRSFYLPRDGKLPLQFFHVDDLCRMIDLILKKHPELHIYNAGNEEIVTAETWVKCCYEAAEEECRIIHVDASVPIRSYFPFSDFSYSLDVSYQTQLIGKTIPLSEGLKETLNWYKAHGEVNKKPYIEYIDEYLK